VPETVVASSGPADAIQRAGVRLPGERARHHPDAGELVRGDELLGV